MKAGLLYISVFAFLLVLIPMLALGWNPLETLFAPAVHTVAIPAAEPEADPAPPPPDEHVDFPGWGNDEPDVEVTIISQVPRLSDKGVDSFLIYDQTANSVYQVGLREYVRGAVASEMPVSFHPEALKAQAVAAHTFALYNHYFQQAYPDPKLLGADFAADPYNRTGYMTEAAARAFYGEQYADEYWNTICEAVDSVLHYMLEYDDEPIVAAYHAMSAGMTEAAENVWSSSAAYLVPAISEGDYHAPNYEVTGFFPQDEVERRLMEAYPGIRLLDDPALWLQVEERSPSGYITSLYAGDHKAHGKDIRTIFGLRSHNIDIYYSDGVFEFTTYGHGHGVGLSQYGADFLARQGWSFEEILEHYYPGAELVDVQLTVDK